MLRNPWGDMWAQEQDTLGNDGSMTRALHSITETGEARAITGKCPGRTRPVQTSFINLTMIHSGCNDSNQV